MYINVTAIINCGYRLYIVCINYSCCFQFTLVIFANYCKNKFKINIILKVKLIKKQRTQILYEFKNK